MGRKVNISLWNWRGKFLRFKLNFIMPLKSVLPPTHPSEIIKDVCVTELNLTVGETAENLGIAHNYLSRILNGRASITAKLAIKIAKAFGSTPEMWLRMQNRYDLYHLKKTVTTKGIKTLHPASVEV